MPGSAARVVRTADMRLSSNDACHSASVRSSSLRMVVPPTLLTRQSIRPYRALGYADEARRLLRTAEVGGDMQVAGPLGASAGAHHGRALLEQLARDDLADPGGRAGDDAHLVAEAEIHRAATLAA